MPPLAREEPSLYHAMLPHHPSTLQSLIARLQLPLKDYNTTVQLVLALTHPSWVTLRDTLLDQPYRRSSIGPALLEQLEQSRAANMLPYQDNRVLATLGNSIFGVIASEHLHLSYPNLPNRVLKAALSAYVGPTTLADVAVELGLGARGVVKWDKDHQVMGADRKLKTIGSKEPLAQSMRAILGLMFQTKVRHVCSRHR